MTTPYLTELLVAGHDAELRRRAGTARLAALARCCRPKAWGRAARRAIRVIRGIRIPGARPAAACCP